MSNNPIPTGKDRRAAVLQEAERLLRSAAQLVFFAAGRGDIPTDEAESIIADVTNEADRLTLRRELGF